MQRPFSVKGIKFGWGRPVVCVPVTGRDREAIVAKIRELAEHHVQMIEWRADCFARLDEPERVREILTEIAPYVRDTAMLFTIRTQGQGGSACLDEKKMLYLDEIAAGSGCVDFVDLELFELTKPEREIARLQQMGVRVIVSHHDFSQTPPDPVLRLIAEQLAKSGGDIAKLAVMPNSPGDVSRLLALSAEMRTSHPDLPVIAIAMGTRGVISRLAGETFGSCITFGADGQGSAPGQLQYETLADMLDTLHESMGRHIFLVGFMGTGKTTVSRELGNLLGLDPIETDQRAAEKAGMTISEMFDRYGEDYFRDTETGILNEIAGADPTVVSCGGGIVLREENRELLRQSGTVVWLTAESETIYDRVKDASGRPVLTDHMSEEYIGDLLARRMPAYEAACDFRVATDGRTPRQIAEEIIEKLK